jgi:hypothetical protein
MGMDGRSVASKLVRDLRRRAGWSQRALAAAAGVPQPTIAEIEGPSTPTTGSKPTTAALRPGFVRRGASNGTGPPASCSEDMPSSRTYGEATTSSVSMHVPV